MTQPFEENGHGHAADGAAGLGHGVGKRAVGGGSGVGDVDEARSVDHGDAGERNETGEDEKHRQMGGKGGDEHGETG